EQPEAQMGIPPARSCHGSPHRSSVPPRLRSAVSDGPDPPLGALGRFGLFANIARHRDPCFGNPIHRWWSEKSLLGSLLEPDLTVHNVHRPASFLRKPFHCFHL